MEVFENISKKHIVCGTTSTLHCTWTTGTETITMLGRNISLKLLVLCAYTHIIIPFSIHHHMFIIMFYRCLIVKLISFHEEKLKTLLKMKKGVEWIACDDENYTVIITYYL